MDRKPLKSSHSTNVYDNFLIHWKYIKREKIVGAKKGENQWKYFYKDDKTETNTTDTVKVESKNISKAADMAKSMIESVTNASKNITTKSAIKSSIENGKQSTSKLISNLDSKSTEEVSSLSTRAALIAGTLIAKVVSKVNHEAGEKVEEKITEKRSEKSRQEASTKIRKDKELAKELSDLSKHDPLPTLPVKTEVSTDDEDMNAINPKYKFGTYGYTMNCSYCTAAYDLRARGYDVEADAVSTWDAATVPATLMSWYDGAELKSFRVKNSGVSVEESAERLEKELESYGDGARGHLLVYWTEGGGHDVIWEVEHGDVHIRDCQTNQKLEVIDYLAITKDGYYFRTDNIQPNEKILETVRSRK